MADKIDPIASKVNGKLISACLLCTAPSAVAPVTGRVTFSVALSAAGLHGNPPFKRLRIVGKRPPIRNMLGNIIPHSNPSMLILVSMVPQQIVRFQSRGFEILRHFPPMLDELGVVLLLQICRASSRNIPFWISFRSHWRSRIKMNAWDNNIRRRQFPDGCRSASSPSEFRRVSECQVGLLRGDIYPLAHPTASSHRTERIVVLMIFNRRRLRNSCECAYINP